MNATYERWDSSRAQTGPAFAGLTTRSSRTFPRPSGTRPRQIRRRAHRIVRVRLRDNRRRHLRIHRLRGRLNDQRRAVVLPEMLLVVPPDLPAPRVRAVIATRMAFGCVAIAGRSAARISTSGFRLSSDCQNAISSPAPDHRVAPDRPERRRDDPIRNPLVSVICSAVSDSTMSANAPSVRSIAATYTSPPAPVSGQPPRS